MRIFSVLLVSILLTGCGKDGFFSKSTVDSKEQEQEQSLEVVLNQKMPLEGYEIGRVIDVDLSTISSYSLDSRNLRLVSSDTSVAEVYDNSLIVTLSPGTTDLALIDSNGTKIATQEVKVSDVQLFGIVHSGYVWEASETKELKDLIYLLFDNGQRYTVPSIPPNMNISYDSNIVRTGDRLQVKSSGKASFTVNFLGLTNTLSTNVIDRNDINKITVSVEKTSLVKGDIVEPVVYAHINSNKVALDVGSSSVTLRFGNSSYIERSRIEAASSGLLSLHAEAYGLVSPSITVQVTEPKAYDNLVTSILNPEVDEFGNAFLIMNKPYQLRAFLTSIEASSARLELETSDLESTTTFFHDDQYITFLSDGASSLKINKFGFASELPLDVRDVEYEENIDLNFKSKSKLGTLTEGVLVPYSDFQFYVNGQPQNIGTQYQIIVEEHSVYDDIVINSDGLLFNVPGTYTLRVISKSGATSNPINLNVRGESEVKLNSIRAQVQGGTPLVEGQKYTVVVKGIFESSNGIQTTDITPLADITSDILEVNNNQIVASKTGVGSLSVFYKGKSYNIDVEVNSRDNIKVINAKPLLSRSYVGSEVRVNTFATTTNGKVVNFKIAPYSIVDIDKNEEIISKAITTQYGSGFILQQAGRYRVTYKVNNIQSQPFDVEVITAEHVEDLYLLAPNYRSSLILVGNSIDARSSTLNGDGSVQNVTNSVSTSSLNDSASVKGRFVIAEKEGDIGVKLTLPGDKVGSSRYLKSIGNDVNKVFVSNKNIFTPPESGGVVFDLYLGVPVRNSLAVWYTTREGYISDYLSFERDNVALKVSDSSLVSFDNFLLYPEKVGTTQVTAIVRGIEASNVATVNVIDGVTIDSITLTKNIFYSDESINLRVNATLSNGSTVPLDPSRIVIETSSNPNLTVSPNGAVTLMSDNAEGVYDITVNIGTSTFNESFEIKSSPIVSSEILHDEFVFNYSNLRLKLIREDGSNRIQGNNFNAYVDSNTSLVNLSHGNYWGESGDISLEYLGVRSPKINKALKPITQIEIKNTNLKGRTQIFVNGFTPEGEVINITPYCFITSDSDSIIIASGGSGRVLKQEAGIAIRAICDQFDVTKIIPATP
ncbi:hypothetical protein AB4307_19015 [Vibrio sp. 10N.261.52.C2]|uniref:hypothetical protein n=1 Tax=Vibrio sp. 10N.261.52.C2 TaxID=3229681 RepID=UPI00354EEDCC